MYEIINIQGLYPLKMPLQVSPHDEVDVIHLSTHSLFFAVLVWLFVPRYSMTCGYSSEQNRKKFRSLGDDILVEKETVNNNKNK